MRWTPEQYAEYAARSTKPAAAVPKPVTTVTPQLEAPAIASHRFTVPGPPMGKPRMTRRDKWAKRDVVVRYRAYADAIRAACGPVPADPVGVAVLAYIAMPASWSEKKKSRMDGTPHQAKPDYDNIIKSIGDSLFDDDSVLCAGSCVKFWCREGHERTVVTVVYTNRAV